MRGGPSILILDEPTANLDVRAPAALFDRMLEFSAGLTTIPVSPASVTSGGLAAS